MLFACFKYKVKLWKVFWFMVLLTHVKSIQSKIWLDKSFAKSNHFLESLLFNTPITLKSGCCHGNWCKKPHSVEIFIMQTKADTYIHSNKEKASMNLFLARTATLTNKHSSSHRLTCLCTPTSPKTKATFSWIFLKLFVQSCCHLWFSAIKVTKPADMKW